MSFLKRTVVGFCSLGKHKESQMVPVELSVNRLLRNKPAERMKI